MYIDDRFVSGLFHAIPPLTEHMTKQKLYFLWYNIREMNSLILDSEGYLWKLNGPKHIAKKQF